jgi:hypothetical protein
LKKALFETYIRRFGLDALRTIVAVETKDKEEKKKIDNCIDTILKRIGAGNDELAPIIAKYFGAYHQYIHLYKVTQALPKKLKEIAEIEPGSVKEGDIEHGFTTISKDDKELFLLLYVPFDVSFHITRDGEEIREHEILHTPVLARITDEYVIVSIMIFTKGDWSKHIPPNVLDTRSHYNEMAILDASCSFLEKIFDLEIFTLKICDKKDYTSKAKKIIDLAEIDLFSATTIKKCETRERTIFAMAGRKTLKETVPEKVKEIRDSTIITELDIIIMQDKYDLPAGSRLTLFPGIGSIRVSKHISGGNIDTFQDYLVH